jgi:hypothetical protein
LIIVIIVALLVLPGGLLAPLQLSPDEAIAKWRDPIGYIGMMSLMCEESILIAKEAEPLNWGMSQVGISLIIYPLLSAIEQVLPNWQPLSDQVDIKNLIENNATSLKATVQNMPNQTTEEFLGSLVDQCESTRNIRITIIERAKLDGATDIDIKAVLGED